LLRHITKPGVDGSAALDFVAGGAESGRLFMIPAFCSEPAPDSRGIADADVAAFDFFFVILDGSKNVSRNYMLALHASHNISIPKLHRRNSVVNPACRVQGHLSDMEVLVG
jgi:hypothetical protein